MRKNAASGALLSRGFPGTPPVYSAGWAYPSWADLVLGPRLPTRESILLLYLLYYHNTNVTSHKTMFSIMLINLTGASISEYQI